MHDIMVKPLPPGCRLTAIFDVRTADLSCCEAPDADLRDFATSTVLPLRISVGYVFRDFLSMNSFLIPTALIDLPYIYSTEGKIKEPNLAAEAGQGLLSAVTSYARGDMVCSILRDNYGHRCSRAM